MLRAIATVRGHTVFHRTRGGAAAAGTLAGPLRAVTFDGGFAPVPQDPSFNNWQNSGWPRGPVPKAVDDSIVIGDFRQWVQMYVGAAGNEPRYYDNVAVANGAPSGLVEIRDAVGPGEWQSGAGGAILTSVGRWEIYADGLHLSYKPLPRPTGPGSNDIDTGAEYRWSNDGGTTWSAPGTLKMTLVKPPSPVVFVDDYGVEFDNLFPPDFNETALTNAANAAKAMTPDGGTLTQRDGSKRFVWGDTRIDIGDTKAIHCYNVRVDSEIATPGTQFYRPWQLDPPDVAIDVPIQFLFVDFDGKAGQQRGLGVSTLWDPVNNPPDLQHHSFVICGHANETTSATNVHRYRVNYCMFYNTAGDGTRSWCNSDLRHRYCDFIGTHRGAGVASGSNCIWHIVDSRVLVLPHCDRVGNPFPVHSSIYDEPVRSFGTRDVLIERVVLHKGLYINTHHQLEVIQRTTWVVRDVYEEPTAGQLIRVGPGAEVDGGRLNCSHVPGEEGGGLTRLGYNGPGGAKKIKNTEIIIRRKPFLETGTITPTASTDPLGAGLEWFISIIGWRYGWTDVLENVTIRIADDLIGHTGPIYGLKVDNMPGTAERQNFLELRNVSFFETVNQQFTFAVEGLNDGNHPDMIVYYDQATADNNAGLIAAGRMWGPATNPILNDGNEVPYVAVLLLNQSATVGASFSYQFASGSFVDPEGGPLTYTSTLKLGTALPAWLIFTPGTRTFSKSAGAGVAGTYNVRVRATDPGGRYVWSDFDLTVT